MNQCYIKWPLLKLVTNSRFNVNACGYFEVTKINTQLYIHFIEFLKITHKNTFYKYISVASSNYRTVYRDITWFGKLEGPTLRILYRFASLDNPPFYGAWWVVCCQGVTTKEKRQVSDNAFGTSASFFATSSIYMCHLFFCLEYRLFCAEISAFCSHLIYF